MRFPLAAMFFVISGFIFLAFCGFSSLLISSVGDALTPTAPAGSLDLINLMPTAFLVIAAIFFVTGILLIFILDSLQDEPETYWR